MISSCDEVIRPRLFQWVWGATVGRCLLWTAEAHEAQGRMAEAERAAKRLLQIRSEAGPSDALAKRALMLVQKKK